MKKKRLVTSYLDLPVRFKILLWFIPLLLITVAVTGWYSYYTAKNQVLEKINRAQLEYTNQISNQLDYITNDAVDFTNYLFLLSSVQQFLNPITQDDSISRRKQISEIASSLLVNQRDFQSLVLYGFNEEVPPLAINQTGVTSTMPFSSFTKTQHYKLALEQAGKPSWTLLTGDEHLFEGDSRTKIILTRVIKNSYTLKDLGMIVIGINEETLRRKYTKGLSNNAQLFIVHNNNKVITSTDGQWIGKDVADVPYFEEKSDDSITLTSNEWIVASSQSENGWNVLLLQPREDLLKELNTIKVWTFIVTALCFLMGVWFSWYVSLVITKPLKKLTKSIYQLQKGDFTQQVSFRGNDEVGKLGRGYDHMVQQMKKLIDDVFRSQLSRKEAELKTLQAQIHPHFLYNTLDTIFWRAQQKKEADISDMIYSLSQFFRLSLSDGKEFVTVQHELLLIKNYLTIQKNRFTNKFTFEIQVADDLKEIHIPKLLIQPLVENAVLHGLDSIEDNGLIYIHIVRKDSFLLIDVVDNGNGIEKQKLNHINKFLQKTDFETIAMEELQDRPGYALLNIMERLRMKYGQEATMMIESEQGMGTKVMLRIPLSIEH
ncbi:sensor histidine kinase [Radiobacillus kanasensis]|uniref:sensor histidine kinase n=1 Tax=Radiobacillus kanasensis TaxID=2844358 RepID=UPI001E3B2423|nr:sensor histidine kinase [Radiobacillus kanasensis]UFU00619.1 sensor histidine kinase [Radiobacillus kanasensis]